MMFVQIEKAIKRVRLCQKEPLYSSEQSIRSSVGPEVSGWLQLLEACGFKRQMMPQVTLRMVLGLVSEISVQTNSVSESALEN